MSYATLLADRALIRLSGEDVRGFLQGLVTNDVLGELPVWAGLLTPQGKALFDFLLWADGDDVLIDCEAEQADSLVKRLSMYRLRRPIKIERDELLSVNWSPTEPDAGMKHRNTDMGPWPIGIPKDPRLPELGWRWLVPTFGEDASANWKVHRLSLGVAEGTEELGQDQNLWLECNASELNGVSFTKGCYVGQENTARMNYRQKVRRRLFVLPGGEVKRLAVEDVDDALVPGWLKLSLSDSKVEQDN